MSVNINVLDSIFYQSAFVGLLRKCTMYGYGTHKNSTKWLQCNECKIKL